MSTKTEQRAKEILRLLLTQGKASVDELTTRFATSPASVRRDLARLEERGLVHRTHGGAMLAGQTYEAFRFDASFPVREERFALADQIRRSSRAVCENLAEAWRKRRYKAAFISKLSDCEAEAAETQCWLEFAVRCGYFDAETTRQWYSQYDAIIP